jgi:hypothetical protein
VEWSVDMETEFIIETASLNWLCLVKIDDLPSLVSSIVLLPNNNWSSFFILSTMDIKSFVVLNVDEVFTFISEDLPPL